MSIDRLRNYQQHAYDWLLNKARGLVQLETGTGKTVLGAFFIKESLAQGLKIAVILPKTYLIEQWVKDLKNIGISADQIGILTSKGFINGHANLILVATERMADRIRKGVDVVIVDEAHRSAANTLHNEIARINPAQLIGLTATPCRTDGRGLEVIYDDLYKGPTYNEFKDAGWLAPLEYYASDDLLLSYEETRGYREFELKEASMRVDRGVLSATVWDAWERYCEGNGPTIVFAASLAHAKALCTQFDSNGVRSAHIDGKVTGHDRERVLEDFKSGRLDVITNYGVLVEGFDAKGACNAITARATGSLIFHRQTIGRILRPDAGKVARYIDLVDNWKRLGTPEIKINWSLKGNYRNTYRQDSLVRANNGLVVGRAALQVVVKERDINKLDVNSLPEYWREVWGRILPGHLSWLEMLNLCEGKGTVPPLVRDAIAQRAANEVLGIKAKPSRDAYQGLMPPEWLVDRMQSIHPIARKWEAVDAPWKLPDSPGLYLAFDCRYERIMYIGQDVSILNRWWNEDYDYVHSTVFQEANLDPSRLGYVYLAGIRSRFARLTMEEFLIKTLTPVLNVLHNKSA